MFIYLPVMISGLVMGYILYYFVQFNHGIFNEILGCFGRAPVDWLADGGRGRMIITVANSWQFVGISMVMYLAGLQGISKMYYEAAEIDGAAGWNKFKYITFPLLAPAVSSAVILNLIGGLKLNDIIIAMTKGGPALKTHSLSTYISYLYFDSEKAGYASAVGIVMFVFIFIVSTILNKYFRSREVEY
jgi:raffinose/stachyose/melibiose transport system permease protein